MNKLNLESADLQYRKQRLGEFMGSTKKFFKDLKKTPEINVDKKTLAIDLSHEEYSIHIECLFEELLNSDNKEKFWIDILNRFPVLLSDDVVIVSLRLVDIKAAPSAGEVEDWKRLINMRVGNELN